MIHMSKKSEIVMAKLIRQLSQYKLIKTDAQLFVKFKNHRGFIVNFWGDDSSLLPKYRNAVDVWCYHKELLFKNDDPTLVEKIAIAAAETNAMSKPEPKPEMSEAKSAELQKWIKKHMEEKKNGIKRI